MHNRPVTHAWKVMVSLEIFSGLPCLKSVSMITQVIRIHLIKIILHFWVWLKMSLCVSTDIWLVPRSLIWLYNKYLDWNFTDKCTDAPIPPAIVFIPDVRCIVDTLEYDRLIYLLNPLNRGYKE